MIATVFAIDQSPRMIQNPRRHRRSAKRDDGQSHEGYTAFFDSVLAASKYLDQSSPTGRRRIVVVFPTEMILRASSTLQSRSRAAPRSTGGVDAQTRNWISRVLETQREVQRSEITFYSINPSGQSLRLNARATRAERGPRG
jgi:hypothetical protein